MKYYVTADVHGFYSILHDALEEAGFFEETQPHKLIILGDLFDRGMEAPELQEFILKLMEEDRVILVKGNHEDLFEEMLTEDAGLPYRHHVSNGTYMTALQLTGYKTIIPAMLDYYETQNYVFTHGWIPCIREKFGYCYCSDWRESSEVAWQHARWYNGMDAAQTADEEKTILCGHWHCSYGHAKYEQKGSEFGPDADFTPYYGPHVIALDACTAHSKRINVLVLEDDPL